MSTAPVHPSNVRDLCEGQLKKLEAMSTPEQPFHDLKLRFKRLIALARMSEGSVTVTGEDAYWLVYDFNFAKDKL